MLQDSLNLDPVASATIIKAVILTLSIMVLVIVVIYFCIKKTTPKQNRPIVKNEEVVKVDFAKGDVSEYLYRLRNHIMTSYEEQVFRVLCSIFESKCYVIPQVHLSKLLDHKVKGQNWQGAFAHINGKSVDFVLLKKSDLSPMCVIEVDDWTHRLEKRKDRDLEVSRMLTSVELPLIRLKNIEYMTKQEIVDQIAKVMNQF